MKLHQIAEEPLHWTTYISRPSKNIKNQSMPHNTNNPNGLYIPTRPVDDSALGATCHSTWTPTDEGVSRGELGFGD